MKQQEIDKAAKIAGRRVPYQWRQDTEQEVVCRCLELQASGVKLTPENVSAVAVQTIIYAFNHWVHNTKGGDHSTVLSLDAVVEDSEGNQITLADALPSPEGFANVEEWALARLALRSMPPQIAKFAAMALIDKKHLPKLARQGLQNWAKAMGIEC